MQKIEVSNMWFKDKYTQVTILKTCSPIILRVVETEKYCQIVMGFFNLVNEKIKKYNKSFINGSYQNSQSKRKLIRTFTIPNELINRYKNQIDLAKKAYEDGGLFKISDLFSDFKNVDVYGYVKGRGFTGGMKRHNFDGLRKTHGVSVSHRSIGSTGCRKPKRVIKGRKMPGRYGNNLNGVRNLNIVKIMDEQHIMIITGSVSGHKDAIVKVIISN